MAANDGDSGNGGEVGVADQDTAIEGGPAEQRRADRPSPDQKIEEPLLEEAENRDPRLTQLRGLRRPISISAFLLGGLFALALLGFLYFAQQLVVPIVLAVLLNFLLSPFVRAAQRCCIPRPVSGVVLVCSLGAAVLLGVYVLSQPASRFLEDIPNHLRELDRRLQGVSGSLEQLTDTARAVEDATIGDEDAAAPPRPGVVQMAFGYAQSLGIGALAAVILLLFLLCSDEIFLHRLVRVLPTLHDKRLAVEIFRQIERDVSHYLLTITLINTALGTTAGLLLWLVGAPTPALWGAMVGLFNFIPYLGPGMAMVVLAFVGLTSFDSLLMAVLPPLMVLGLNILEANILTPLALGKRLDLNPVMIFLALSFWGFLWGIPGMVLAVPLLVMVKIVSDHIEPLTPLREFLSGEEPPPAGTEMNTPG